ncbi:MAG: amino acid ABC transporter permease [Coriobacteriia bacterium]|nr:amino acid ABC transporter permease [Coriobacteriia bacterium]MBN2822515.1 amino acid ABC transporter permease [Coriobacteriia bacterium]
MTVIQEHFWGFFRATGLTLQLTAVSLALAVVIGLLFAFLKLSNNRVANVVADAYIGLTRGLPLIVQLMFLYFGISSIVVLSSFWAGSLALAFHAGGYVAEIFRGAIQNIDRGQTEAARSLGMSPRKAMRLIVLPQAFRRAIPSLGNQFIIGLKDSTLVAYLGVPELFSNAMTAAAANYKPFETYLVAGMYYLVLVVIFTWMVNKLEVRLTPHRQEATR